MSDTLTLRSDSRSMTIRICAMMLALVLCVGASLIFRSPYRVAYAEDTSGSETIIDAFTHGGQVVYNVIKKVVLPLAVIVGRYLPDVPRKERPGKGQDVLHLRLYWRHCSTLCASGNQVPGQLVRRKRC